MAIAQDTTVTATTNNGSTLTTAAMTTSGTNMQLVAILSMGGINNPTSISDPGGGLTWVQQVTKTATDQWVSLYTAFSAATITSQTFTSSWTGANGALLQVTAFSGCTDLSTKTANVDYRNGTAGRTISTNPHIALTTIGATGSFIVAGLQHWASATWTPGTNTTTIGSHINSDVEVAMRTTAAVSAGSNTVQGTVDSEGWIMVACELLIASAGGVVVPQIMLQRQQAMN